MWLPAWVLVLLLLSESLPAVAASAEDHEVKYVAVGVSGGLQDGFPDHVKMNYVNEDDASAEPVQAILVGRALVRGAKAYLDVMEGGWRQYSPEPEQPLINSVVLVSGCQEHANQYWIYLVDSRKAVPILNNEPRFLSITPDTLLVDLQSNETDEPVKLLARHEIRKQGHTELDAVAFPVVVATHYHLSFVPSPAVRVHRDGTRVTNFAESLALWAGVDDADRTAGCDDDDNTNQQCASSQGIEAAHKRYWDGIRTAVRFAENNRLSHDEWKSNGPPFQCRQQTRLGVSPNHARINYPFTRAELAPIFEKDNFSIDFNMARLVRRE